MTKKRNWITAAVTLLILCTGFVLSPLLNNLFFNVADVIDGQADIESQLANESSAFIKALLYPVNEETVPLSEEEHEARITDITSNSEILEGLFRMYDMDYEKDMLEGLKITLDKSRYILQKELVHNGESYLLYTSFQDNIPDVFIISHNRGIPTLESIRGSVDYLNASLGGNMSEIESYVGRIEMAYGEKMEEIIFELSIEMDIDGEISPGQAGLLWRFCEAGNWGIYSNEETVLLACVMGRYTLILHYDPNERIFNGYSLALNQDLF